LKPRTPTNLPASIHDRLLRIAKERKLEFQDLLINYALERWLYRLSQSPYQQRFILKGAMLFALWTDEPHRSTQDLDLLGYGTNTIAEVEVIFREIGVMESAEDGLVLPPEEARGSIIREDRKYEGVRVNLLALLGKARIPLQVDVGFGDAVIPAPVAIEYPTLLKMAAPQLRAYQRETVVAEKFHAMVERGISNSRAKDYFDLWIFTETFAFDGEILKDAIQATFTRQRTTLPESVPVGLSASYGNHPEKQAQWRAFLRRGKLRAATVPLPNVVTRLHDFLMPAIHALRAGEAFTAQWLPQRGWNLDASEDKSE
jgi:predicted nucleotidyltransferase component of viral defense system